MKLLTKELEVRFKEVGSQEPKQGEKIDPIVICKFFNPAGAGTWFATEYDPVDKIFFGFVSIHGKESGCDEWGSFSLDELESLKLPFGLGIERDIHFTEKRFSEVY